MKEKEYVLGTGMDEQARLGLQHRIWADASTSAWKKAGVGPGSKVVDVGSGPGFSAMDLADLVTPSGEVWAVDESEKFLSYIRDQARHRNLKQIRVCRADVEHLTKSEIQKQYFDVAYCRWVLCWLKDPRAAIEEVAAVLKPGGRFVVHDYFNWQTMGLAPRSEPMSKVVIAAVRSFADSGGDIDIAAKLLGMLKNAGFKIDHFDCHQRVARGGGHDSTAAWPLSWWRTYAPKLVEMGKLSEGDCRAALNDLEKFENDEDIFYFCPPVFEFVAVKDK